MEENVGLLVSCPFLDKDSKCPFFDIRNKKLEQRVLWWNFLTILDKIDLVKKHKECLKNKEGKF